MGFLDALRRSVANDRSGRGFLGEAQRPDEAIDPGDSPHPEFPGRVPAADPAEMAAPPKTTDYDRDQWHRKLKRIIEKLPDSKDEWPDLMAEAGAFGLDTAWVEHCQREEFTLMVHRIVSDCIVTFAEHQKLDLARTLIGIPDAEAEAIVHDVVAEAESFFGKPVEGA